MAGSTRARKGWIALGVVLLLAVLAVPTMQQLYLRFPELFGHHDFYIRCKALKAGAPLARARQDMARYLEVGRTWSPPQELQQTVFSATVLGSAEPKADQETRSIFVPNRVDVADWCIVYSRDGVIARVELSPD